MEHWEEVKPGGYRFVWDDALFPPGTDTFLLSAFPRLRRGLRVCDLGCGTGLLSLLLLQRQSDLTVTGVELLPEAVRLMERCVRENRLTDRICSVCMDLREVPSRFSGGSFDLVASNPPYFAKGRGAESPDPVRRSARSEGACTVSDLFAVAGWLVRWGGSVCLVHRPDRLSDLLCAGREHGCEPKRLRFVCKTAGSAPSLCLLECRRGGKPGLTVEAELVLQKPDGSPTAEVDQIYFRT